MGDDRAAGRQRSPRWARPLIFALCLAALTVGFSSMGFWWESRAFWPEAIPPYVQYLGDDYHCMGLPAPDTMAGLTLQGHTVGGGLIYARPPIGSEASEGWVVVTDGHRRQTCIYNGMD